MAQDERGEGGEVMRVKHLIRELRKCDPEAEVVTEGSDRAADARTVKLRRPGEVIICRTVSGEAPYDNAEDTPDPLPPRMKTKRRLITPIELEVSFTVDRPGSFLVTVNDEMQGAITEVAQDHPLYPAKSLPG